MTSIRRLTRRTRHAILSRRETLLLHHAQGTRLTVERGCLWVTLESDPRDIVLCQGMRFEIDRPGRTVIAAEVDSALRLSTPVSRRERVATALLRAVAPLLGFVAGRPPRRTVSSP